jgi:hypothetical protein
MRVLQAVQRETSGKLNILAAQGYRLKTTFSNAFDKASVPIG